MVNSLINRGDAVYLLLNFTVRTSSETTMTLAEFVQQANVTEMELALGSKTYKLSTGDIMFDETYNAYYVAVTQPQSFALRSLSAYQLRLKRGDFLVCSSDIIRTAIGGVISQEVL